jgi:hypothetical protein
LQIFVDIADICRYCSLQGMFVVCYDNPCFFFENKRKKEKEKELNNITFFYNYFNSQ